MVINSLIGVLCLYNIITVDLDTLLCIHTNQISSGTSKILWDFVFSFYEL